MIPTFPQLHFELHLQQRDNSSHHNQNDHNLPTYDLIKIGNEVFPVVTTEQMVMMQGVDSPAAAWR